jgi:hypothetical protein
MKIKIKIIIRACSVSGDGLNQTEKQILEVPAYEFEKAIPHKLFRSYIGKIQTAVGRIGGVLDLMGNVMGGK